MNIAEFIQFELGRASDTWCQNEQCDGRRAAPGFSGYLGQCVRETKFFETLSPPDSGERPCWDEPRLSATAPLPVRGVPSSVRAAPANRLRHDALAALQTAVDAYRGLVFLHNTYVRFSQGMDAAIRRLSRTLAHRVARSHLGPVKGTPLWPHGATPRDTVVVPSSSCPSSARPRSSRPLEPCSPSSCCRQKRIRRSRLPHRKAQRSRRPP